MTGFAGRGVFCRAGVGTGRLGVPHTAGAGTGRRGASGISLMAGVGTGRLGGAREIGGTGIEANGVGR